MIRKTKALGLAVVAVFAMSAVVASAAQASSFVSEGGVTAAITADQVAAENHVFTVDGTEVKCKKAHFATEGEVASGLSEITVHPTYSECTAFGFVGASVNTTGCNYVLHAGAEQSAGVFAGTIDVACSGESKITISASTCEAKVGSQSGLGALTYTNESGKVKVAANVTGITVQKTKDGFLCPLSGTGTVTNGAYKGDTIAEGTHLGSPVGISVE